MKNNNFIKHLFILFLLCCTTSYVQAQKTKLQLKLPKGSTYSLQMNTDQLISQEIMGAKQDVNQKISMTYDFHVEDVASNGLSTIKVTYKTFSIKQETPMGTMEYDSEKSSENTPEPFKAFSSIVGQSYTMKLTPEGNVKELLGVDALLDNMINSMNISDSTQKKTAKNTLKSQFGDEALKTSMESMMAFYPDKPVGIGDTWNKNINIAMGIPMVINTAYTLKGRQNGLANIDVASKIEPLEGAPMEISGMKLSYQVSGDQTGTMQLDEKTGFTKSSDLKQNLTGTITMSGAQMPEPMTWPINVTSHVVIKAL